MKIFSDKQIIKRISLMLLIITVFNVFLPLTSEGIVGTAPGTTGGISGLMGGTSGSTGGTSGSTGGKLFQPMFELFAKIGDLVIMGLQQIFIGDGQISTNVISEIDQKDYMIRYSPGIIFSNTVPGLDANFISPMPALQTEKVTSKWIDEGSYSLDDAGLATIGFTTSLTPETLTSEREWGGLVLPFIVEPGKTHIIYEWTHADTKYMLINTKAVSATLQALAGDDWLEVIMMVLNPASIVAGALRGSGSGDCTESSGVTWR